MAELGCIEPGCDRRAELSSNTLCRKCYGKLYQRRRRRDPEIRLRHSEREKRRYAEDINGKRTALARYCAAKKGFSEALEAALHVEQKGRCAICAVEMTSGQGAKARHRDHDHETRKARGFLCGACNLSLGYYERYQRIAGLVIEPYEKYLADPPAKRLERNGKVVPWPQAD